MHPPCSGLGPVAAICGHRQETKGRAARITEKARPLWQRFWHSQWTWNFRYTRPQAGFASMRPAMDVGSAQRGKDPRDRHHRDHRSARRRR